MGSSDICERYRDAWRQVEQQYPEANFLQSPAWGKVNELVGHQVVIVDYGEHGWCLMMVKNAKRGRYLEVPGGPLVKWDDAEAVQHMFTKIKSVATEHGCVFVRLRPQLKLNSENVQLLERLGTQKAPMHLHAEHTIIIDLEQSEAELLAKMRRQTRYEVRRARKLGIQVDWSNSQEIFEEFQQVQAETAARQHFVPPNLEMLLAEREGFGEQARMYVARTDTGEAVAYGLILISGAEAEYFEAASTDLNRKLPGSYALLWQAMRDLKQLGIKRFNLWGIAPPGVKDHRYAGVTTFKMGFGGDVVEFVPAQDIIVKRVRYLLNLAVEKLRKRLRHL